MPIARRTSVCHWWWRPTASWRPGRCGVDARFAGGAGGQEVDFQFTRAAGPPWSTAHRTAGTDAGSGALRLFDLGQAEGTSAAAKSAEPESEEDLQVYTLRIDGGSRGNPGPSAIGVVIENERGEVVEEIGDRIGHATNNVAEYQALLTGLETALDRGVRRLRILSDSLLLVRQMRQEFKVKNVQLRELWLRASALVRRFDRVEIKHVRREENAAADLLVNKALDGLI